MKDFLRQNGGLLLIIALLLSILIGVGSMMLGGVADPLSNIANTVTTPIRSGISAVRTWAGSVYDYVAHYDQLHQQLEQLEQEVARLEDQVRDNQSAQKENEQLRQLLGLQQKRSDFVFESARVTARASSNWESTMTINKGSVSGVAVGDCIISSTGVLVGVVTEVGLNWATVSSVIDPGTQMGGIVARTYSAGVLEGEFELMRQGKLRLSYLPDQAQLVSGDEVLTSGKGSVYPSGLLVGHVDGVFTDPSGMTRYAVITPEAALDELVHVYVIKEFDIVE